LCVLQAKQILTLMLYLILAILTSTLIVVVFKLFDRWRISNTQAILFNYLLACVLGFALSGESSVAAVLAKPWFYFSALCGTTLIITFFLFGASTQKAGVAITAVSGKMSVLIPVVFGFFMFHETPTTAKIAGIITALLAFYLTFKKKEQKKAPLLFLLLPFLLFLGNGFNDSMLKIAQSIYINGDFILFLSTAFFFSFILGLIILGIRTAMGKERIQLKNIAGGLGLGILNWYSTYYFLVGLSFFEVSFFIPVFNVSIVILSAVTGMVFFREKLSRLNLAGILLASVAIVLMAIG
jgi:uncharacterized membrane protein